MTASVNTPAPAAANPVQIREIQARLLTVDHAVQRALDAVRVDRIVGDFDVNALGTLVVSQRADGTFHVIDGQHRLAVIIALGHEDWNLRCEVHTGLTRQEEARMFRLLNNARPVSVIEKFLVRIQEEDPVAVSIADVLAEAGWTVSFQKTPANFCAVSSIEKPYRRAGMGDKGKALVEWVINVVTKSWGFDPDGVRGDIVTGLSLLHLRHGDAVDTKKLIDELTVIPGGPRGLVGRARSLKDFRRGTIADAMAEQLVSMINNKRRVNRLPAWRDDFDTDAPQD